MSSTTLAELHRRQAAGLLLAMLAAPALAELAPAGANVKSPKGLNMTPASTTLTDKQLAIGPVAAAAAVGDLGRLHSALNRALDAGLTINEGKEVLVQLYAYAGFPRALNALTVFMKVLDERKGRGVKDEAGKLPSAVPTGDALLTTGTANQTKLSGGLVAGPLFDFAPAIDQFLKTHLFGDIFARDNLDWQSRELATVAALSALTGVESQQQAHVRISLNVGLTEDQLRTFAAELKARDQAEAGQRALAALDKHLSEAKR